MCLHSRSKNSAGLIGDYSNGDPGDLAACMQGKPRHQKPSGDSIASALITMLNIEEEDQEIDKGKEEIQAQTNIHENQFGLGGNQKEDVVELGDLATCIQEKSRYLSPGWNDIATVHTTEVNIKDEEEESDKEEQKVSGTAQHPRDGQQERSRDPVRACGEQKRP